MQKGSVPAGPIAPQRHLPIQGEGTLNAVTRAQLAEGRHPDPHTQLGVHDIALPDGTTGTVVRTMLPGKQVCALAYADGGTTKRVPMTHLGGGLFEAVLTGRQRPADHRFETLGANGRTVRVEDAYRFPVTIGEQERWLFNEGTLKNVAKHIGANARTVDGVDGYSFVTWAPNAQGISVVGDFNGWADGQHAMRRLGDSGLWEVFVPGVEAGESYKLRVVDAQGGVNYKSDPFAKQSAVRPETSSVTVGADSFEWNDDAWMKTRRTTDPKHTPVSKYELHLASWRQKPHDSLNHLDDVPRELHEVPAERTMSYREIADELVPYLEEHRFTHVELLGLMEHPLDSSWGYQVSGYYAPTSRHGSPEDLKYLVDKLHAAGIGVVLDWVPGHFPKDGGGIARFDGTHLFDHEDDRLGEQRDWNTRVFNYGRNEVRTFLLGSLQHMLSEFHFDGVRMDGVASMLYRDYSREEWIPNEFGGNENLEAIDFIQKANNLVRARFPGVMRIAEESTSFPGVTSKDGLAFDTKWNMGWMHDTLEFFKEDPMWRGGKLDTLTNTFMWAHSEQFVCSLSHDEVVHGKGSLFNKMPGDDAQKAANLRLLYGFMWSYPGHKLLFMGQEHAQRGEWDFRQGLQTEHLDDRQRGMQRLVADLNGLYIDEPALHEDQFDPAAFANTFRDTDNGVVGLARGKDDPMLFVHNVGGVEHQRYRIGVDRPGDYRVVLDTNDEKYGGHVKPDGAAITAEKTPWHGKPYSIEVSLAPLGSVAIKRA
ncbi:MAG: 1,4-alpha-glucan branching protein GlgB [Deltaproteobacteria bacterium]